MSVIRVNLRRRSYPVVIGSNMASQLPGYLLKVANRNRLFVVYDARAYALHGGDLSSIFSGFAPTVSFAIPGGERSKSVTQLNRLQDFLLSEKMRRDDTIVAVGGGVISDLVGYAAASTLRGISWAVIPTTLIGMVDAAIGGKTGINHYRGKNLIGAFWQPRLVWSDTRYLMTLPERELIGGLGEILKYAGLGGDDAIRKVEAFATTGDLFDAVGLRNLIHSCVRYKARIVEMDERDNNRRMFLNFGHTFCHAIETAAGHGRLRHGEALILGLKAALHLSGIHFPESRERLERYGRLIDFFRRLVPRRKVDLTLLGEALAMDKKRSRSGLNFILLQKPGKPIIARDVKLKDITISLEQALQGFKLVGKLNG